MQKQQPVWFGMKVTPDQKRKIKHLAKKQGLSAKEAVMRLVEDALVDDQSPAPSGSFLAGIEDIVGSVEGPSDLSTNPTYLQGFGK